MFLATPSLPREPQYKCVLGCSIVSNPLMPYTVAFQSTLSMEFSRQEYWSGLPFSTPGDLPHPRTEPASPALAGGFFTTSAIWETPIHCYSKLIDQMNKLVSQVL